MVMYVVYQTGEYEDTVCAISHDREVACDIAGYLDTKVGAGEYWVDDIPVSHSLGEYKGQNNA